MFTCQLNAVLPIKIEPVTLLTGVSVGNATKYTLHRKQNFCVILMNLSCGEGFQ